MLYELQRGVDASAIVSFALLKRRYILRNALCRPLQYLFHAGSCRSSATLDRLLNEDPGMKASTSETSTSSHHRAPGQRQKCMFGKVLVDDGSRQLLE